MTNLLARIAAAHYVATEADIESLAHARYSSAVTVVGTDDTYLRVLLVESQSKLGQPRGRTNKKAQLEVLAKAHARYYPSVVKGVTTADIAPENGTPLDPKESHRRALVRNSRSNFARSATSTLRAYLEAGGDMRALDPEQTSKAALRAAMKPPEPANKVQRQLQRTRGAFLRAIERQARKDQDGAGETIDAAIEALNKLKETLGESSEQKPPQATRRRSTTTRTPRDTGPARTRVGVPSLVHRPS